MTRRVLGVAFVVAVLGLLANLARDVDWAGALVALRELPPMILVAGACLAVASHMVYSTYDLIGRQQTGHGLPVPRVAMIGFVSYAFNLNLGSLVGGVGLRYRLYSRQGLDADVITRVLGFSIVTNWAGYVTLAGIVLLVWPPAVPADWRLGRIGLTVLGGCLLLVAVVYVLACVVSRERTLRWREHQIGLPSGRVALLQIGLSCVSWMLIAAITWVLLQQRIEYSAVLGALMVAALAGVLTHVPAGLGVLEAVFLALLSHRIPQGELLGALLAYRALYYLMPLALATPLFFLLDARARPLPEPASEPHPEASPDGANRGPG